MRNNFSKVGRVMCLTAFALLLVVGAVMSRASVPVSAEGGVIDTGGVEGQGGNCYKNLSKEKQAQYGTYYDECYGATWVKVPATDHYCAGGATGAEGGSYGEKCIDGCVSKLEAKYIYHLGIVRFNTDRNGGILGATSPPVMMSATNPSSIAGHGGKIGWHSTGVLWSDVKRDFEYAVEWAKDNNKPIIGDDNFDSAAMFCWNEDWKKSEYSGEYASRSSVSGGTESGTSDYDGETSIEIDLDEDSEDGKVTLTFWHEMKYEPKDKAAGNAKLKDTKSTSEFTIKMTSKGGTVSGDADDGDSPFEVDPVNKEKGPEEVSRSEIEVEVEEDSEAEVCQTITYKPKYVKFTSEDGKKFEAESDSKKNKGTYKSKACAKIKRGKKEEEEEDPEEQDVNPVLFYGKSEVKVEKQDPDILGGWNIEVYDAPDKQPHGVGKIIFSTDGDKADVIFEHSMTNTHEAWNWQAHTSDDPEKPVSSKDDFSKVLAEGSGACVQYEITGDGSGGSGQYCAKQGVNKDKYTPVQAAETVTISVPGKACQTLTHDVEVPLKRTEVTRTEQEWKNGHYESKEVFDHWEYDVAGSPTKKLKTQVCVEVYKPNEAEGDGPVHAGNANSNIMYAGEDSSIGWSVSAVGTETRRLIDYQSIAFEVNVEADRPSADNTKGNVKDLPSGNNRGNRENKKDPCQWYREKFGQVIWCTDNGISGSPYTEKWAPDGNTGAHSYSGIADIAVPNHVGDKYCNSAGYQWGYWHGIGVDNNIEWTHDPQDYWVNYGVICKTIAKKTSFAVWNGGVKGGSFRTPFPIRYLSESYEFAFTGDPGTRNGFGSWTEYLNDAFGTVKGFASGGAIAKGYGGASGAGLGGTEVEVYPNLTTMTISNIGGAGNSGIATNNILRSRLEQYLFSGSVLDKYSITDLKGLTGTQGTKIYVHSGDLTISDNITLSNSSVANIYQIPQVLISVKGNVNIAPDVSRVDAWIIASGQVNTCSQSWTNDTGTHGYGGSSKSTDVSCDKQLVVNGPVMADGGIKLNRTFGSDENAYNKTESDPENRKKYTSAEIFSLGGDAYLWAYAQASRSDSSYTEAYLRELPPRY